MHKSFFFVCFHAVYQMRGIRSAYLDTLKAILKDAPGTPVVMLTVSEDADDLMLALRAGAQGYLLKNLEGHQLRSMIDAASRGDAPSRNALTLSMKNASPLGKVTDSAL